MFRKIKKKQPGDRNQTLFVLKTKKKQINELKILEESDLCKPKGAETV